MRPSASTPPAERTSSSASESDLAKLMREGDAKPMPVGLPSFAIPVGMALFLVVVSLGIAFFWPYPAHR